jgi:hypothetical protein
MNDMIEYQTFQAIKRDGKLANTSTVGHSLITTGALETALETLQKRSKETLSIHSPNKRTSRND